MNCEDNKTECAYVELQGDKELDNYRVNRRKAYYENEALERQRYTIKVLFYMYFILLIAYVMMVIYKGRYSERGVIIFVLFATLFPFIMNYFLITLIISLIGLIWRNIPKFNHVYF